MKPLIGNILVGPNHQVPQRLDDSARGNLPLGGFIQSIGQVQAADINRGLAKVVQFDPIAIYEVVGVCEEFVDGDRADGIENSGVICAGRAAASRDGFG